MGNGVQPRKTKRAKSPVPEVEASSGNVFADLEVPNALQVEEFSNLELWRHGSCDRAKPDDRGKEAVAAVDFRKEYSGDWSQAGRVDDQRGRLPLFGRQRDSAEQIADLLVEGPGMV